VKANGRWVWWCGRKEATGGSPAGKILSSEKGERRGRKREGEGSEMVLSNSASSAHARQEECGSDGGGQEAGSGSEDAMLTCASARQQHAGTGMQWFQALQRAACPRTVQKGEKKVVWQRRHERAWQCEWENVLCMAEWWQCAVSVLPCPLPSCLFLPVLSSSNLLCPVLPERRGSRGVLAQGSCSTQVPFFFFFFFAFSSFQ